MNSKPNPEKYRCRICRCLWRHNGPTAMQPKGSWSIYAFTQKAGPCCDNHPGFLMVIEPVWE